MFRRGRSLTRSSIELRRALVWAAALVVALAADSAVSDVVRLKDGTTHEGEIRKSADGWVVTRPDGSKIVIPAHKVAGLEATAKKGDTVADQRLASLRRAVEAMPEIKQIIDRYKGFITQFNGTPAADAAKADLVIWQDRLDRGLVKAGELWMTPVEREALLAQSFETAARAVKLFREGRTNEGIPLLEQALVENPDNAAAWYMKGILLFKQDKAVEARKAFETASSLAPDHSATYNNLAVVLWRQHQHVAALLNYEKALLASPLNRVVLDNMSEALAALPAELREGHHVKRIVRHFNDQDLLLQQQMAGHNLHRWGATWVDKAEKEKLQAIEREIQGRIDQMEIEYNGVADRLNSINADIDSLQQTLRQMEANSVALDASGRQVRYPLPPSYYAFVREMGILKAERDQRIAEQEHMRQQALKLVQSLPTPKYNGVQRLVEWEGAPIFGNAVAAEPAALGGNAGLRPQPAAPAPPATTPAVAVPPPAIAEAPPIAQPPATQPAPPRRPLVPHERPSILDRRFADPPPPSDPPSDPAPPSVEPRR